MNIKFNAANAAKVSGKCQNIDNHSYAFNDGEIPSATERYIRGCVHKTAMRYALNDADAEDLAQEIYRAVYKRIREFDEARNAALTTFLHLCVDGAVSEYIRSYKRLKNTKLVFILDAPVNKGGEDEGNDVEESLVDCIPSERAERERCSRDLKSDVAEIIKTLSPELRTVCVLFMEGKSAAEVAKVIGRPRQNIYSLILPKLRKAFAEIF